VHFVTFSSSSLLAISEEMGIQRCVFALEQEQNCSRLPKLCGCACLVCVVFTLGRRSAFSKWLNCNQLGQVEPKLFIRNIIFSCCTSVQRHDILSAMMLAIGVFSALPFFENYTPKAHSSNDIALE